MNSKMNRAIATVLTLFVATFARMAEAQPSSVHRIGFLSAASASAAASRVEAFRLGLRELGYVEGANVTIEYRWADGREERLPGLATELVARKVDVIVTQGTVPTMAAHRASATIPIVMATAGDPVATGLVASLSRPGGNVTGLTQMNPDVAGKRVELLREMLPAVTRVAILWNPGNPVASSELGETEAAARSLRLGIHAVSVKDPDGFPAALSRVKLERPGAIVVLSDIMFFDRRQQIASLAAQQGLPVVAWTRELADAGALMTYGPNTIAMHRRAAAYVDKVLEGAKPAELPIEQPVQFELVINLLTARSLGLTVPSSILFRADQVIE
jgi:putative tryptophan/tyrosine transport system substrate-binding protein